MIHHSFWFYFQFVVDIGGCGIIAVVLYLVICFLKELVRGDLD